MNKKRQLKEPGRRARLIVKRKREAKAGKVGTRVERSSGWPRDTWAQQISKSGVA
mgnify:CR=1 FL=1